MKLLYRYILKEFFSPFLFSLLLFCLLFLVSEFFFRLSDFLVYKAAFMFIINYHLIHIPLWVRDCLPISVLFGVVFSLNRLMRDGEIIAIKSCGINLYRFLCPLIFVGLGCSIIGIFLNLSAVSYTFRKAKYMREVILYKMPVEEIKKLNNFIYSTADGHKITAGVVDFKSNTMYDVTIDKFDTSGALLTQTVAKKMLYTQSGWMMYNGVVLTFASGGKELIKQEKFQTMLYVLDETMTDFLPQTKEIDELTTAELRALIARKSRLNQPYSKELTLYIMRFSYPVASLVVVFLGAPLAFGLSGKYAKMRGVGYVLVIVFSYWALISLGRVLGEGNILPAALSAWFSNIVFLAVGLVFFSKISR